MAGTVTPTQHIMVLPVRRSGRGWFCRLLIDSEQRHLSYICIPSGLYEVELLFLASTYKPHKSTRPKAHYVAKQNGLSRAKMRFLIVVSAFRGMDSTVDELSMLACKCVQATENDLNQPIIAHE